MKRLITDVLTFTIVGPIVAVLITYTIFEFMFFPKPFESINSMMGLWGVFLVVGTLPATITGILYAINSYLMYRRENHFIVGNVNVILYSILSISFFLYLITLSSGRPIENISDYLIRMTVVIFIGVTAGLTSSYVIRWFRRYS